MFIELLLCCYLQYKAGRAVHVNVPESLLCPVSQNIFPSHNYMLQQQLNLRKFHKAHERGLLSSLTIKMV